MKEKIPLYGDLHVHTALSLDANTQGTLNTPDDAYRYAKGESLYLQPYNEDGIRSRISKLITQCRIYVSTYNATTFLESLSLNVPTIMFWNPEHWELREEAKPYFQGLLNIGILHYTHQSAAKYVVDVWDHVEGWWAQEDLQQVSMGFGNQYSRV